ncbi:MAG: hydantoinase/oxoprolinase family protein [Candidatus Bruticola sp.]
MSKFRVGIDVGGTFTHAVAVDNDTLQVTAHCVAPTTHQHEQGVAAGIIDSFRGLCDQLPQNAEIVFLAHSTTQATNALLEGDVSKVGIIALGGGLEGVKVKSDTNIGSIELAPGKFLHTGTAVLNPKETDFEQRLAEQLRSFKSDGVGALVAAEGFSVDDPQGELKVLSACAEIEIPACATHQMSGLYGLSARTQTAVFNASILPKMISTALMTKGALESQQVKAPLMVMRSDGGVMDIDEVQRRPVLTLLSGPAAGIAACLMFLKASDALFLEVGGTSTDICMIKDGRAALKSASIGGRDTYLRTLDSRTLGVAGGSMIGWRNGLQIGPRSAHLAGYTYCSFAPVGETASLQASDLKIKEVTPLAGDQVYFIVQTPTGREYALTSTCAANMLGFIPEGSYSFGNVQFVTAAFEALAAYLELKGERPSSEASNKARAWAESALNKAADIIIPTLKKLISDYKMENRRLKLIGGGGGCAAIVPFTAKRLGLPFELAKQAEVISAIGAALAMVRECIERTIVDPTPDDLQKLRRQAEQAVIKMGAEADSVEVTVEIDAQKNLVRAVAQGAIAFSNKSSLRAEQISEEERLAVLKTSGVPDSIYKLLGSTGFSYVYRSERERRVFFGLFKKKESIIWVTDAFGSARLQRPGAVVKEGQVGQLRSFIDSIIKEYTSYGDAGALLPAVHLVAGHKLCNLSTLIKAEQMIELALSELGTLSAEEKVFAIIEPGV